MKKNSVKKIISLALAIMLLLPVLSGCNKNNSSDIRITEIVTSNSQSYKHPTLGSPDWIELYNPSSERQELSGYMLVNTSKGTSYTFPEGAGIDPGAYIIVCCSKDAVGDANDLVAPFNLSASGCSLSLVNKAGRHIQDINVPELQPDHSYAMKSKGGFGISSSPTPGAANSDSDIGEAEKPTAAPSGNQPVSDVLVISEVMRGDTGFIEVHNISSGSINLSSYYLSDDGTKPMKWQFPEFELASDAYAAVYLRGSTYTGEKLVADGSGIPLFYADFKLNSAENTVYLHASGGRLLAEFTFDNNMSEGTSAVLTGSGIAYTVYPTPGYANSDITFNSIAWTEFDGNEPIIINEVLLSNKYGITDSYGERSDWVEIYNRSDSAVSLFGYYLTDDKAEPNKWAFPNVTIEPGEYLLVFCSGRETTAEGELHASFSLSLRDGGVYLANYNGMHMGGIDFPETLSDNISIGRGPDGGILYYPQPTPGEENRTTGFAEPMSVGGFDPSSCYISETCSVNEPRSGLMDWVELYNGSDETMTLTGWHISDSESDLMKYDLSGITIPSGGYAVISCSDSILDASPEVAPFSLSPAGETLFITNELGVIVDVFETGTNKLGVTSGRNVGEGERVYFAEATKGSKNPDTCYLSYAAAPKLSDTEIYHTEGFYLEIIKKNSDGTVRYTLDGSKPDETSPVYTEPLYISSNTVVRAAVFVPGVLQSDTVSMTYLFEERHSIPVVTIAMEQQDFSEMYAVSRPFVPVVERECFMQFFETDGTLGVESAAGVRVSGASTRAYPQKSLGLYFRSGYGRNEITYPFFGEDYYKNFGSLVLRNAGQDYTKARIRDSFASKAMQGLNLDTSESRFVAVYINGQYWGLYDLKENMNEDFLATHFGVDPDTANIIKRNTMELEGSNEDFLRVRAFAAHFDEFGGNSYVIPMTEERYEQFKQWVDVENIMDYLIARNYLPDFDMFNQKYWRTTDYSVKWRAIFFDSDFAMSSSSGNLLYHYFNVNGVPSANGSLSQMDIFCGLNTNDSWRHDFIVRYIYVMKYHLNADRLTELLDSMAAEMSTEMDRHIARWGTPSSRSAWETEIASLRRMLVERPSIAANQLRSYYGLTEAQYSALEAEADAYYAENGAPGDR